MYKTISLSHYNKKRGTPHMNRTITYYIDSNTCGVSIYDYLKSMDYSSKCITELKKMNRSICIQNEWVYLNRILQTDDILTIQIEESASSSILPKPMDLSIIYEDEDLLVINKPANLPVHPSQSHYEDTLANGVMDYYLKQGVPYTFRCMNRIDRDTTGLVLLAKHLVSAAILGKMVATRQIKREYLALVEGIPTPPSHTIIAPIARTGDSTIMREVNIDEGDTAITHYKTLATYENAALLHLTLETGRTHQIRVHMSSIGHPLRGDSLYNPNATIEDSLALHSAKLTFEHPIKKELLTLEAPLPFLWTL